MQDNEFFRRLLIGYALGNPDFKKRMIPSLLKPVAVRVCTAKVRFDLSRFQKRYHYTKSRAKNKEETRHIFKNFYIR